MNTTSYIFELGFLTNDTYTGVIQKAINHETAQTIINTPPAKLANDYFVFDYLVIFESDGVKNEIELSNPQNIKFIFKPSLYIELIKNSLYSQSKIVQFQPRNTEL